MPLNNSQTRTAINAKISVFVICVETIIYLLLYKLHDCTFNVGKWLNILLKSWGDCIARFLKYAWPFFNILRKRVKKDDNNRKLIFWINDSECCYYLLVFRCSTLPLRYSMAVRSLFKELLQMLKPDTNMNWTEKEILPIFREKIDVQKDDVIRQT